jgi:hypothetical protein
MSRFLLLAPVTLAIVLALIPSPAPGCAIAPLKGQSGTSVQTASEEAVIIYDQANRMEHFIRTASFMSSSAEFGFLVPTPSKPEIAEADPAIYSDLANLTKPKVEIRKVSKSNFGIGCGMPQSTFANVGSDLSGRATPAAKNGVHVVEQKRVGNLIVNVLQAETPQALRDWLGKNGYDDRPELTEWLKPYTTMKWYISAFKMAADVAGPAVTTGKLNEPTRTVALTGTTVRMSFQTDRPFYPYREPSDVQNMNPPGGRMLRVYMLASTISTGLIGFENGKPWPGRAVWAGLMTKESAESVANRSKVSGMNAGNTAWFLTEFEDRSSPRPGTDELYFGPALDQSPIERPPIIKYEYIDRTSEDAAMFFGIVFVVVIALALGIVGIVRRFKRAA